MHTLNKIAKQIVELSAFKAACSHYLASKHAATHVENATIVTQNVKMVNHSLKQLYKELDNISVNQFQLKDSFRKIKYNYSSQEESAIIHFNNDNRFTITE